MHAKKEYFISELEKETGLNRRTIHFYIQQGVIPPPHGAGGGARYGEVHVLRLKLIPLLQRSHLKLSGITRALDAMSLQQMRRLVKQGHSLLAVEDPSEIGAWMLAYSNLSAEPDSDNLRMVAADYRPVSFLSPDLAASSDATIGQPVAHSMAPEVPDTSASDWRRISLEEGIELHVRADLLVQYQQLLDHIESLFKPRR